MRGGLRPAGCVVSCACPARDAARCVEIRYPGQIEGEEEFEPCECVCHDLPEALSEDDIWSFYREDGTG